MAENLPQDELLGSWHCSIVDPLKGKDLAGSRGYVLNALVGGGERPLASFYYFVYLLKNEGLRKMVSLFPEQMFTVLNVVEYELHFVVLTLRSSDFCRLPETTLTNFPAFMDNFKSMLSELKEILRSESLLDEEQALRVDAHCKKIVDAFPNFEEAVHLEMGGLNLDTKNEQPFFSEHFSTENEKVFMTRLREICLRAPVMDASEALKSLAEVCQSADMDTVLSSDVLTHNAMRMAIKILLNVADNPGLNNVSIQQKIVLLQKFTQLNKKSFLDSPPSFSLRYLAWSRIGIMRAILERKAFNTIKGPELLDDKTLGVLWSALWQKLSAPAAAAKYSSSDVFKHCAICANGDVSRKNFAILDVCDHLYCVDCISRCFFEFQTSKCPYCRQDVREFTTRDFFLSKVNKQSTSDAATK